jgi:hypothetical protein
MSQRAGQKPLSPSDLKQTCQCDNPPCNCGDEKKTTIIEKQGMTNTQKWLAIIGLTLLTYYVILKVNKN